jgi:hypothetical protein
MNIKMMISFKRKIRQDRWLLLRPGNPEGFERIQGDDPG